MTRNTTNKKTKFCEERHIYNSYEIELLFEELKKNTTINSLKIVFKNKNPDLAIVLAKALKENNTLTRLVLGRNSIGWDGAIVLARALKVNNTLTKLVLSYNKIGSEGAIALADALKENNTLTQLALEFCGIRSGAIDLAETLTVNNTISTFSLVGNPIYTRGEPMPFFAEALKVNTTLINFLPESDTSNYYTDRNKNILEKDFFERSLYIINGYLNPATESPISELPLELIYNTLTYIIPPHLSLRGDQEDLLESIKSDSLRNMVTETMYQFPEMSNETLIVESIQMYHNNIVRNRKFTSNIPDAAPEIAIASNSSNEETISLQ